MERTLIAILTILFTRPAANAQQWELVTPIKTRSVLVEMQMTDALTGFAVDRPLGAILKTSNAGIDWERKANNLNPTPNAIWMWDDQRGIVAGNSGRFYHTIDGFNSITSSSVFGAGHASCLYFVNDTLGFTGTEAGEILRTIDGGATWSEQPSGTTNQVFCFYFLDEILGFASAGPLLLRTNNGGLSWEELPTPELVNVRDLHFFDAQRGIGVGSVGLIISTDNGGDTWVVQPSPTTYTLNDLYVNDNVLFACGAWGRTIRSTNGGNTWVEQPAPDGRERYMAHLTPSGIGLMTGAGGYVYRTLDMGATWEVVHKGIPHTGFNKVSFADNGIGVAVGTSGLQGFEAGFARSVDGGRYWNGSTAGGGLGIHLRNDGAGANGSSHTADYFETTQAGISTPSVAIRCVHAFSPSSYIVAGGNLNGGFYRTTSGGGTWAYTAAGNPYDMYFPTESVGYGVGEGNSVYKTMDGGLTWSDLGPQVPAQQFTIFFLDEMRGWTGGAGAGARTTDGGQTWNTMGSIPSYTKSIIFTDADTGYAVGQSGQTVRSTDGGITWVNYINEVFNATFGDAALIDGALVGVANNGDIYRAQLECPAMAQTPLVIEVGGTLLSSSAEGNQWYDADGIIPGATSPSYTPTVGGPYHVVVTDDLGCVSELSNVVNVVITALSENEPIDVLRIHPNPSGQNISLGIPGHISGSVELMDIHGRRVLSTLINSGGIPIDISTLPSGVYLVKYLNSDRTIFGRFVKE